MNKIGHIFRISLVRLKETSTKLFRMSAPESILSKNRLVENELRQVREEFATLKNTTLLARKEQLRLENAQLLKQVEVARQQLIELETRNGKKQISVPNQNGGVVAPIVAAQSPSAEAKTAAAPPTKEKKQKKEKPTSSVPAAAAATDEAPIDVGRLDLRVGRIVEVALHPDADSLYVEKIDCGEASPRTIISGLVKHVPIDQMQNRLVVVLCNLKPAKMRGITSEGMVMCASSPEAVEVLLPPADSQPGDLVSCDGFPRQPDVQLNPKKKIFETCAPDLRTNDALAACYKGVPWQVAGKGLVLANTLKGVAVK